MSELTDGLTHFYVTVHSPRGSCIFSGPMMAKDADELAGDVLDQLHSDTPNRQTVTMHIVNVDSDGGEKAVYFDSHQIGGHMPDRDAQALYDALQVIVSTPVLNQLIASVDPKALAQAEAALLLNGPDGGGA